MLALPLHRGSTQDAKEKTRRAGAAPLRNDTVHPPGAVSEASRGHNFSEVRINAFYPGEDAEREAHHAAAKSLRETVYPSGAARQPSRGHDFGKVRVHNGEPAVELFRGAGKALEDGTRAHYEARFGHHFSDVRIHDDSESVALNRHFGARAFAVGNHVAFADEERSQVGPGSYLLAHELAHVIQQRQAGVARVMRQPTEEGRERVVAPPCPGSCHVHVEYYQRAFDSGLKPLPPTPFQSKQLPLTQEELQALYDFIARPSPGPVSGVASTAPASNELTEGNSRPMLPPNMRSTKRSSAPSPTIACRSSASKSPMKAIPTGPGTRLRKFRRTRRRKRSRISA